MNKKILVILFFILASCIYGEENLTDKQKEARKWFEKAERMQKTDMALAIEYYTKAIELDHNFVQAYVNRGLVYKYKGDYNNAINDFSKAIELEPQDVMLYITLYYNRGFCYWKKKDYDKAMKDYTKAIEVCPNFAIRYYALGYVFPLEDHNKALNDFIKAMDLDPKNPYAYFSRGLIYVRLDLLNAACEDFYQAGVLFLKQRDKERALLCVETIRTIDRYSPLIKKLMNKIYGTRKTIEIFD